MSRFNWWLRGSVGVNLLAGPPGVLAGLRREIQMGTTSIPSLPRPSAFTLTPSHFAGRRALKGFEFQTAYIAYVLSGFAAGREDFVCCRVEAVEDLDALVRVQDTWVERYYQIKSMQEGIGRWTLNRLDQEESQANGNV